MKVTKETTDKCEVILTVEIDDKQKQKLLQKAARRIAKAVHIPGFRPGKAPYNLIVSRFGEEAIQEEATEDLTTKVYQDAIKEAGVEPYGPAALEDISWEPLVLKIRVPTEPVVELGNYRDVRVEVEPVEVTDEEIQQELERLRERFVTISPVERPAQMGDVVSVSAVETDTESGEEIDRWEREIGLDEKTEDDGTPNFRPLLVDKKAGDTVELTHSYPDDFFDDKLAGKTVNIVVTVQEVKEREDIPLDDDFAAMVGDYESLDDLKTKLREDMLRQKKLQQESKLTDEALEKIIEEATIKWPQSLEEQELNDAVQREGSSLQQYGIDFETLLKIQKKTFEEFREDLRERVQKNLQTALALGKIVELENISVDNDDIRRESERMTAASQNPEEMANMVYSESGQRVIANNLLTEKALRRVLEIAKGEADTAEETTTEAESADETDEKVAEPAEEAKTAESENTDAE